MSYLAVTPAGTIPCRCYGTAAALVRALGGRVYCVVAATEPALAA